GGFREPIYSVASIRATSAADPKRYALPGPSPEASGASGTVACIGVTKLPSAIVIIATTSALTVRPVIAGYLFARGILSARDLRPLMWHAVGIWLVCCGRVLLGPRCCRVSRSWLGRTCRHGACGNIGPARRGMRPARWVSSADQHSGDR